jgi:D-beta-D-heptose 7-phosphate kinase/D-beta-D-heptose 1-phosphate adenosyltransferase
MIVEPTRLAHLLLQREFGNVIVMTNGCFDLLHAGHINNLYQSKRQGDVLIVAVNSDESVRRLKGESRPYISLNDRMAVLDALEMVDYVTWFDEDTPESLICDVRPSVLTKGGDYTVAQIAGHQCAGRVEIIPLVSGHSTTGIANTVVERSK